MDEALGLEVPKTKLVVVGKNSSVYAKLRPHISSCFHCLEFCSIDAMELNFDELAQSDRTIIAIFSGLVSNDASVLNKLEEYHVKLVNKLEKFPSYRVFLISSSAVYGTYKTNFSEQDLCMPTSAYGVSKLKIEKIYYDFLADRITLLRLGNVIGLDSVSKAFQRLEASSRILDCRDDGSTALRTYVDGSILCRAFLTFSARNTLPRVLNIGRQNPQSMYEIIQELGMDCKRKNAPDKVHDITLDTSSLFNLFAE